MPRRARCRRSTAASPSPTRRPARRQRRGQPAGMAAATAACRVVPPPHRAADAVSPRCRSCGGGRRRDHKNPPSDVHVERGVAGCRRRRWRRRHHAPDRRPRGRNARVGATPGWRRPCRRAERADGAIGLSRRWGRRAGGCGRLCDWRCCAGCGGMGGASHGPGGGWHVGGVERWRLRVAHAEVVAAEVRPPLRASPLASRCRLVAGLRLLFNATKTTAALVLTTTDPQEEGIAVVLYQHSDGFRGDVLGVGLVG